MCGVATGKVLEGDAMAEKIRGLLEEQARRHRVALSEDQIEQFVTYLKLIQEWQKRAVRLVGSAEPAELVGKHVSDSFAMYNCIGRCGNKRLIDIGSGAGFPGLCLKLIEPSLTVMLLEASARKASFLAKIRADLGLVGLEVFRGRAEDIAQDERFREQFDVATIRAVTRLPRAIELGLPLLRPGGSLVLARGVTSRCDVEMVERIGGRLGAGEATVYSGELKGVLLRGSVLVVGKAVEGGKARPRVGSGAEERP